MSLSICTSCLSRFRITQSLPVKISAATTLPLISSFHTTAAQQAVVAKKKTLVVGKHRESRSARIKRKHKDRPKPPAPGERRTQRKRIVLSNTNALEISGLEYLSKDNMGESEKIGHMLALEGTLLDQLRDSKAFKTTQNWNLFRQPSTLMRNETHELARDIVDINSSREDQGFGARTIQKIVTGERSCGKSIHLLQAMSMAFLNEWVVIHIPECQDFVINNSSYVPVNKAGSGDEMMYNQPHLASELLSRIAYSNAMLLSKMKLNHEHDKSIRVQKHATLQQLAQIGADEPAQATAIFSALWKELTVPPQDSIHKQPRPSILVTIDGLDHWMGPTLYRSSDYKVVHAHQLTLVRHFLDLLFNQEASLLPNGGMVLAATSGSNNPDLPSFKLLLSQIDAMQNQGLKPTDPKFPMPNSYSKVDPRVLDLLKNANNTGLLNLKGLSKPESKGLLEYFAKSGVLREKVTDEFIGSQWSLSGSGIIGQLCKFGSRVRV